MSNREMNRKSDSSMSHAGRRGARDRRNGPGAYAHAANATSEASGEKTRATPQSATHGYVPAQVVNQAKESSRCRSSSEADPRRLRETDMMSFATLTIQMR